MTRMWTLNLRLLYIGCICIWLLCYGLSLLWLVVFFVCVVADYAWSALGYQDKRHQSGIGLKCSAQSSARFRQRDFSSNQLKNYVNDSAFRFGSNAPTPWGVTANPALLRRRSGQPFGLSNQQLLQPSPSTSRSASSSAQFSSSEGGFISQIASAALHHSPPIHLQQYSSLGSFPTVNLHRAPLPYLSSTNTRMIYNPVTVKLAPPDMTTINTPSPKIDFLYRTEVERATPVDSVVSALACRKRTIKCVGDEGTHKRPRRDNSSGSSPTAFLSESPSPSVLNGMLRSTANILMQQSASTNSLTLSPYKRRLDSSNENSSTSKRNKNNEITSSYSSSRRMYKQLLEKRKLSSRPTSPSVKVSKRQQTSSTSRENTPPGKRKSGPVQQSAAGSPRSPSFSSSPGSSMELTGNQQNVPNEKSPPMAGVPKPSTSNIVWKEGFSRKLQLPQYASLSASASVQPAYVPQIGVTVEDDYRDQQANQVRLQRLLSGVNKAFQARDEKLRNQKGQQCNVDTPLTALMNVQSPDMPSSAPLSAGFSTSTPVSASASSLPSLGSIASSSGLLSIASPIPTVPTLDSSTGLTSVFGNVAPTTSSSAGSPLSLLPVATSSLAPTSAISIVTSSANPSNSSAFPATTSSASFSFLPASSNSLLAIGVPSTIASPLSTSLATPFSVPASGTNATPNVSLTTATSVTSSTMFDKPLTAGSTLTENPLILSSATAPMPSLFNFTSPVTSSPLATTSISSVPTAGSSMTSLSNMPALTLPAPFGSSAVSKTDAFSLTSNAFKAVAPNSHASLTTSVPSNFSLQNSTHPYAVTSQVELKPINGGFTNPVSTTAAPSFQFDSSPFAVNSAQGLSVNQTAVHPVGTVATTAVPSSSSALPPFFKFSETGGASQAKPSPTPFQFNSSSTISSAVPATQSSMFQFGQSTTTAAPSAADITKSQNSLFQFGQSIISVSAPSSVPQFGSIANNSSATSGTFQFGGQNSAPAAKSGSLLSNSIATQSPFHTGTSTTTSNANFAGAAEPSFNFGGGTSGIGLSGSTGGGFGVSGSSGSGGGFGSAGGTGVFGSAPAASTGGFSFKPATTNSLPASAFQSLIPSGGSGFFAQNTGAPPNHNPFGAGSPSATPFAFGTASTNSSSTVANGPSSSSVPGLFQFGSSGGPSNAPSLSTNFSFGSQSQQQQQQQPAVAGGFNFNLPAAQVVNFGAGNRATTTSSSSSSGRRSAQARRRINRQ